MEYRCFVVSPTRVGVLSLRRYAPDRCTSGRFSFCNAETVIDVDWPVRYADERRHTIYASVDDAVPTDDPRWPTACENCGQPFTDDDTRQVNQDEWFDGLLPDGSGTHVRATLRHLPPGAMYVARWMDDNPHYVGPDGHAWVVVLPPAKPDMRANAWYVYGPSSGEDRAHWTVTGTPPDLTVSPSIQSTDWHGFLRSGVLVE